MVKVNLWSLSKLTQNELDFRWAMLDPLLTENEKKGPDWEPKLELWQNKSYKSGVQLFNV